MTEKRFTFHISEYDEVVITKENDGREFFIGNEEDINIDYIIGLVDLLNEQHEENQKLKEEAKQVLFVLACCNRDFGLSVNEAKAIKRLNECVDGCYNINNIKEYLND
jgi:hypothetical protein